MVSWKSLKIATLVVLLGPGLQVQSQVAITITSGYALGTAESVMAEELLKKIASEVGNIEITYLSDTTGSYGSIKERFSVSRVESDLVFLYAGMTEQIGEIAIAAERDLLQPVDALPDFHSSVKPDDIYQNLLVPAFANGHLWAVPIRLSLPMIVVDEKLESVPQTWADVHSMAKDAGILYTLPRERYMLWLTRLAQQGYRRFESGKYVHSSVHFTDVYHEIQSMLAAGPTNWSEPFSVGVVTSNSLLDIPQLSTGYKFCPIPAEGANDVYWFDAIWYIGVGAHVSGHKREFISKILAGCLSSEIQQVFADVLYSPPVRPSIAKSSLFLQTYKEGTPQRTASEMTERLRFRSGGKLGRDTESIMQAGFETSLSTSGFEEMYSKLAASCNELIENQEIEGD